MGKGKAGIASDAVRKAIYRQRERAGDDLKPIEILKAAISAYLANHSGENPSDEHDGVESTDRRELRRGTQAAVDRMLFDANYWRAAYEDRIVEACNDPEVALECLRAISVWTNHTLKLNTLSPEETIATFERFCPPFRTNNRRGSASSKRSKKGPLPDFAHVIDDMTEGRSRCLALQRIYETMSAEADLYEQLSTEGSLDALFTVLPAWCLQNRIELVSGSWWDDHDVMSTVIDVLHERFIELGFGEAICRYFLDSCYEALDAYHRDLTVEHTPFNDMSIPELVMLIRESREEHPSFETDGYGSELPSWLISKEQLIWNILVCTLYGPASARPLLVDSPSMLAERTYAGSSDVITELARTSFMRYTADRVSSQADQEYKTFSSLPPDLRDSSFAYISSIHGKLETLGYSVLPAGSCYPERCVNAFTDSEVECLAILEHRRWMREREQAGWSYGRSKDVDRKQSPYMVAWEELPERAREWNRSAVRSIPSLLASVNLCIVR